MGLVKLEFVVLILLSVTLTCLAQGNITFYDFIVKEVNFTRLCVTKSMLTVNGSFPGPVLRVHKGDTVFVNVHNEGDYGVTIHWHGVKNPGNPWSDGTEHITQCAIQPGLNMTYEVKFTTEEGTLWWHAHSDWTAATVHGAIVVLPAVGTTYPFPKPDEEEIIVLAGWFIEDVNQMVSYSLENGLDFNRSNAFTINGQPGDLNPCSNETTYKKLVDHGKTYLLRIVNAATNQELFFSIAQHSLTVVGLDGAYIKPIVTNYIMIAPGQTMDVLVTTNQSLSHYYMAARPYYSPDADASKMDNTTATSILQYRGNYTPPASPFFPTLPAYRDQKAANDFTNRFRSLASQDHPVNVPKNFTMRLYMTVSLNRFHPPKGASSEEEYWFATSLNNMSFNYPHTNILEAYYRNLSGIYDSNFPDEPPNYFNFTGADLGTDNYTIPSMATEVKVLKYNEAVEMVFQDTNVMNAKQNHPMHLHGFSFYVVGTGYGNFNNKTDPMSYNLVDPPLLNTVGVPKNGWVAIRFIANNPGVWFVHCHMERHTTWGMNTVLIVKNGGTAGRSMREPYPYMPVCTVPLASELQTSTFSKEI